MYQMSLNRWEWMMVLLMPNLVQFTLMMKILLQLLSYIVLVVPFRHNKSSVDDNKP